MKRFAKIAALSAAVALTSGFAHAQVAEDKLNSTIETFMEGFEAQRMNRTLTRESATELSNKALSGLDVQKLTIEQIIELGNAGVLPYADNEAKETIVSNLKKMSEMENVKGAKAAALTAMLSTASGDGDAIVEAFGKALSHPAIAEAMADPDAQQFFATMGVLENFDLEPIADALVAFGKKINDNFSAEAAMSVGTVNSIMGKVANEKDADMIRENLTAWAKGAKEELTNPQMVQRIDSQLTLMNGAYGQGKLIGYEAPDLHFTWISDGGAETLDDYKSKVVVLDFWATWCGPCIRSFPDIAKLQKFYEGYPVEIIGVTSLQGTHFGADGQRIDTEGNPAKEHELMKGFMDAKDMTWTVAFTKEEVYNPEYGVQGIPHVAIIDPSGKTRYNGIHPSSPFEDKVTKINKLLKEADLEHPVYED